MKTWVFHLQLDGEEVTYYRDKSVSVTDKQYDVIQDYLSRLEPLTGLPFYKTLCNKAERGTSAFALADMTIDDPGDIIRLNKRFCGRKIKGDFSDGEEYHDSFCWEIPRGKKVSVGIDIDRDGIITKVYILFCEGNSYETVKYMACEECYPPFDFISEKLEEELGC